MPKRLHSCQACLCLATCNIEGGLQGKGGLRACVLRHLQICRSHSPLSLVSCRKHVTPMHAAYNTAEVKHCTQVCSSLHITAHNCVPFTEC
jgi:hypothetical protein